MTTENDDRDDLEIEENTEEVTKEELEALQKQLKKQQEENKKMGDALTKSNKEAKERRLKLKELNTVASEFGLDLEDPDQLKSALDTYNKQQDKSNQRDTDMEKLKKQFDQRNSETKKEYEARLKAMEQSLHENMITAQATSALSAEGVEYPDVLMPHIERNVSIIQTDAGKYVTRVLDEDGDPRFNNSGEYMGISDLVVEMKESPKFQTLFPAKVKSGGGSVPSGGKAGGKKGGDRPVTKKTQAEFNPKEKSEYVAKYGGVKRKDESVPSFSELPFK